MKKLLKFIRNRYVLLIFLVIAGVIGLFIFYRLFLAKANYAYVQVKVGQGYWWASTDKPPLWLIENLKKEVDNKNTDATLLSINYYPYFPTYVGAQLSSQYNLYLNLRLKTTFNKSDQKYYFNRSLLEIGAPIDLEFARTQLSGSITELDRKPINYQYEEKIVYLSKKVTDLSSNEYQNIVINDNYFDGQQEIIKIISKDQDSNNITIKTKVKLKKFNGQYFLGPENIIIPGQILNFITSKMVYYGYIVNKIE